MKHFIDFHFFYDGGVYVDYKKRTLFVIVFKRDLSELYSYIYKWYQDGPIRSIKLGSDNRIVCRRVL